ncbi:MAG TPA: GxxExxY protein [Anaerolineae bacterium]|nr:GxxExxY protein [Anaerolineae bacterium]
MSALLHKQLTYTIRGTLFDIHNQLGPMLPEKAYQKAVVIGLEKAGINCEIEKRFDVYYEGINVGWYFVDVWLEQAPILLELKVAPQIEPIHKAQALSYLKITNADLALLVNFGEARLTVERLPNFLRDKQAIWSWDASRPLPDGHIKPQLTNHILEALHHVHFTLGPGYFHHIYRRATRIALRKREIYHRYIKKIPIFYHGEHLIDQDVRLISIESCILVATVAVQNITAAMKQQLKARLKALNHQLAILANFNGTRLDIVTIGTTDGERNG